jgi:hypothetical protein
LIKKFPFLLLLLAFITFCCLFAGCKSVKSSNLPPSPPPVQPLEFNVILETSASMKGYLNGDKFKKDVTNFIAELDKIASEKQPNLPVKSVQFFTTILNNKLPGLVAFKGSAYQFSTDILNGKIATGSTSPIDDIVLNFVEKHDRNKVSFIISDFVPDVKDKAFINIIPGHFKNIFTKAKTKGMGLSIYRIISDFSGTYYPSLGKPITVKGKIDRPYFVWILGDKYILNTLRMRLEKSDMSFVANEAHFGFDDYKINYHVLYYSNNPQGRFKYKDNVFSKISLQNDVLKITIGMDLYGLPAYARNSNYLKQNTEVSSQSATINYSNILSHQEFCSRWNPKDTQRTHYEEISISNFKLPNNIVSVRLKKYRINWDSIATSNDSFLTNGNNLKTFCLKEMLDGIQDGYGGQNTTDDYYKFDLLIKK